MGAVCVSPQLHHHSGGARKGAGLNAGKVIRPIGYLSKEAQLAIGEGVLGSAALVDDAVTASLPQDLLDEALYSYARARFWSTIDAFELNASVCGLS